MLVTRFMKTFFILWASFLLFSGCSVKEYAPAKSMLVTFKSDAFRFNDMGYIRKSKHGVEVELFSTGQLVERFVIETNVCSKQGCLSKDIFNSKYLHVNYDENIIANIFRGEPIFNEEGLEKTADGFKQVIKANTYNIIYKVNQNSIYFKDKKNSILIKIREIK